MQVYLSIGGKRYGPFTVEKLNRGIATGKVNVHQALAWWDGCTHWQSVAHVPGVQVPSQSPSQAQSPSPAPPPAPATGGASSPSEPTLGLEASPGLSLEEIDFAPVSSPPTAPAPGSPIVESQTAQDLQTLIPYKNKPALIAYYLGILGLVPILGFPCAVVALILGIKGLRNRAANPQVRGSVHAWIGIVLGGLVTLGYVGFVVLMVVGLLIAR